MQRRRENTTREKDRAIVTIVSCFVLHNTERYAKFLYFPLLVLEHFGKSKQPATPDSVFQIESTMLT